METTILYSSNILIVEKYCRDVVVFQELVRNPDVPSSWV